MGTLREIIEAVLNAIRPFRSFALILSLAVLGCHAQNASPTSAGGSATTPAIQPGVKLSPEMARRIEVMIRSKSDVPSEYVIGISEPSKSDMAGYAQIIVTFTAAGKSSRPMPFLISADGKTLAQFNKFDLSKDPKQIVSAAGRPARGGPADAPVLIVGFDDLECPFCAKMNAVLFPAILDRYKDQVRVVYRDFPIAEIHPWATHAAIDANCLAAETTPGYWNYVDYVHAHAEDIAGAEKTIVKANQTLDKLTLDEGTRQKVDMTPLTACVQKQDDTKVKTSLIEAEADPLRVDAAPILFINGEKVTDALGQDNPLELIDQIIDRALIAAGQTPPPPLPHSAPITPAKPGATSPSPAAPPAPAAAAKPGS
jgi:protein-disulfide isomerase